MSAHCLLVRKHGNYQYSVCIFCWRVHCLLVHVHYQPFGRYLYIVFAMLTLLNMIIAVMGEVYADHREEAMLEWELIRLLTIREMELSLFAHMYQFVRGKKLIELRPSHHIASDPFYTNHMGGWICKPSWSIQIELKAGQRKADNASWDAKPSRLRRQIDLNSHTPTKGTNHVPKDGTSSHVPIVDLLHGGTTSVFQLPSNGTKGLDRTFICHC